MRSSNSSNGLFGSYPVGRVGKLKASSARERAGPAVAMEQLFFCREEGCPALLDSAR
jgi:hypothetical protein